MLHCALAPFTDGSVTPVHTTAIVVVDGHALCSACELDWHRYRADTAGRYETTEFYAFVNWLRFHDNPGKPGGRHHPELQAAAEAQP